MAPHPARGPCANLAPEPAANLRTAGLLTCGLPCRSGRWRVGVSGFMWWFRCSGVVVAVAVEVVELALYAGGVVVAVLFPVQLQGFKPHGAGLLVLAEGGMGVAERVEGVGGCVGVPVVAEQG
jgi:hypothetical protein